MCYNMKTVFILGKKKEEIMGTKAPYQTKQMKQILAYLQTIEGTHVTAADVCSYFKEQGINVGTTTVYRNLEKMVEQRLVAKYNVMGRAVPVLNISEQKNIVIRPPVSTANVKNVEN